MKNNNFIGKIMLIAALLICCAAVLCSCGGDESSTDSTPAPTQEIETTADYTVTVTDYLGKPFTDGVVVSYLKDGEQIAMQVVNEEGKAIKNLDKGDYTVALKFTGDETLYYYEKDNLTLSADVTSLEVAVAYNLTGNSVILYKGETEYVAPVMQIGSLCTKITENTRNYFVFQPSVEGLYKLTVHKDDAKIGYYGAPHFIQDTNVADIQDEKSFSINVYNSMISPDPTSPLTLVVGIDSATAIENCIITVERVGEPEFSYENVPWDIYKPTVTLGKYTLPAGSALADFDLKASSDTYKLVYNENDGFYHLNSADGPLVLVRLAKDSKYLASFKTILESSGVVKYFFDENGEFVKKEDYSECLLKYIENVDEKEGVYPLTNDLMYIIQNRGDASGWFDPNHSMYLFKDSNESNIPGINNDISWLFMCCYIK